MGGLYKIEKSILFLLRFSLGGLFIYAGVVKALDPVQLARDIQSYRLLPYLPTVVLAFYLPYLEIVCGAALIAKIGYPGVLNVLLVLLSLWILALGSAWIRGLDISCGCFGRYEEHVNYPWVITRDMLIMALVSVLKITGRFPTNGSASVNLTSK